MNSRILTLLALTMSSFAASTTLAAALEQADVFNPSCISTIDIVAPQDSVEALYADPRGEYQPGTLTFNTCGQGTDIHGPVPVTLRLKGSGSFRTLDGKAAFKIKFAKPNRPDGLKSFTLNNMVQDGSSIREVLGYETLRKLGIVAARAGYATVTFNGEAFGLYANIETLDDRFVEQNFDSMTHLFEAPDWRVGHMTLPSRDVLPESVSHFEVDEGDEEDRDDLIALAATSEIVNDDDWWAAFQHRTNATAMLRVWAATYFLAIGDQYPTNVNNYNLHSNSSGVFTMIPSGIDEFLTDGILRPRGPAFHLPLRPESSPSVLVGRCFAHDPCRAAYLQQLEAVARTTLESLDLVSRAHELFSLVSDAALSGRSEQTTASQCASARDVVAVLRFRAEEIHKRQPPFSDWGPITPAQRQDSIPCLPQLGNEPAPPMELPTAVPPLPTLQVTKLVRLRTSRSLPPRFRLHLRARVPHGQRWSLRVRGVRGRPLQRPLSSSEMRIEFRSEGQHVQLDGIGELGARTSATSVKLPRR